MTYYHVLLEFERNHKIEKAILTDIEEECEVVIIVNSFMKDNIIFIEGCKIDIRNNARIRIYSSSESTIDYVENCKRDDFNDLENIDEKIINDDEFACEITKDYIFSPFRDFNLI